MIDPAELELELANLGIRELLLKLYGEVRSANGRAREHMERTEADLYGDEAHQVRGIKAMVQDHDSYIGRARFISKLAVGVMSVTGLANLGALIALIKLIAGN